MRSILLGGGGGASARSVVDILRFWLREPGRKEEGDVDGLSALLESRR